MKVIDKIKTEPTWTIREYVLICIQKPVQKLDEQDLYNIVWDVVRQDVEIRVDDVWIKAYREIYDIGID